MRYNSFIEKRGFMRKIFILLVITLLFNNNFAFAEGCGCENLKNSTNIGTEGKKTADLGLENPITVDKNGKKTKCLDLMTSMYNERATLYNVLNLSSDQQKCKDVIDAQRYDELKIQFQKYEQEKFVLSRLNEHEVSKAALKKQEKVVKDIEHNMQNITKKYDKEFKSILNSEQKAKLRTIRKMERNTIKHCQKNKAFYNQDPNLRPFGVKMYENNDEKLCPVHNKWHLFGLKHKK